jgi:hypothetical protein
MRVDLLSTNFSGGEISPRLYGRPDLAKYNDSVKRGRDVTFLQHGGVRGRPGTHWLGEVKDSTKATRLIPMVVSQSLAYVLEMGDTYMRVWKDGAVIGGVGSEYEITTPYTTATVFDVDFTQGADTMFLALQSITPYRLQRFADNRWVLGAAPIDPVPFDEIGHRQAVVVTLGATSGATTATGASPVWLAADVGRKIEYAGGSAEITGYSSTTVVNVTVSQTFSTVTLPASEWVLTSSPQTGCTSSQKQVVGDVATLTLDAAGWRSTDVGKFVLINGGMLEITGYTSALIVDAKIVAELASTSKAQANAWSLESAVWNAIDGYPATVSLHEQRLIAASTPRKPQTIWGSKTGLYLDFTKGTADDDGYSFELGSDEINPVMYLSSGRDLVALTFGGAWILAGGIEKPITPTNVRARQQSKAGAGPVRPEQVDDDLFYSQRAVSAIRSLLYQADFATYKDSEASILAEHLVSGVDVMTFQQTPERVLWMLKDDGTYLGVTLNRDQNLQAFSLNTSAGSGVVESMATIPENGQDRTYMVVRRTVNGVTKRYIERMSWTAYTDCTVTKTPASATVSGLAYLEGKTVACVADGIDLGDFTVTSGVVTLPRVAASVVVGLRYTPTVQLLPPEFGTGMGAALGKRVHNGKTSVLFRDTIGCSVNGQALPFRSFGDDVLDEPVNPYTGWIDVSDMGWERESGEITLTQPQAYPWNVLAVVRRMTSNPG